jgi:formylglycine-generating enzyme required for sulfatase activity
MKFAPAPGTKVLFSVWLTRARDFGQFAHYENYNPPGGFSLLKGTWGEHGHSWQNAGFDQTADDPVCCVNFEDAKAFCAWLTRKEAYLGRLPPGQIYRLPTDGEWSLAAGPSKYPWGDQFPPPPGAGNFGGEEAADADWPKAMGVIRGYNDGYARTSPVGKFQANPYGLFDMGGNLWEWCDDWYRKEMNSLETRRLIPDLDLDGDGKEFRVLRGASWGNVDRVRLATGFRRNDGPGRRSTSYGFRCVLAPLSNPVAK